MLRVGHNPTWLMRYTLDFDATFYLNRRVPAGERVNSLTGVSANAQNGAIAFTTTQWSVVLNAQGESPSAQEALEKLCRTYWWPLYGFVRRQGYSPEEAQDCTQGFFAMRLFDLCGRGSAKPRPIVVQIGGQKLGKRAAN